MNLVLDLMSDEVAWGEVLSAFPARFFSPSTMKTLMPLPIGAEALAQCLATEVDIDLVVGAHEGAWIAAELVARGRARRGVLLEPSLLGLVADHWELAERSWSSQHVPDPDALEAYADETASDYWGHELIGLLMGVDDPDPSIRAQAAVAQRTFPARMPFDRSIEDDGAGQAIAEWSGSWCDPELDIQVWLPEQWSSMADALDRIYGAGPVVRQPWPPAAWLLEPEKVAAALAAEVPTDH